MPAHRQTLLSSRRGRLAVVGAASLASVLISTPAAVADAGETVETTSAPAPVVPVVQHLQQSTEPSAPPVDVPVVELPAQGLGEAPVATSVEPAEGPTEDPAGVAPPTDQPVEPAVDGPVQQPAPPPVTPGGDAPAPTSDDAASVPSSARTGRVDSSVGRVAVDDQAAAVIVPDFGDGKFRTGGFEVKVDVAEGSAPGPGLTTAGSTFSITETSPVGVARDPFTCTTETRQASVGPDVLLTAAAASGASTATFCVLNPTPDVLGLRYTDYGARSNRVTVRQLTAAAGLVAAPVAQSFDFASLDCSNLLTPGCLPPYTFSFVNALLPPVAVADSATTPRGTRVVVVVQRNDVLQGLPATGLVVTDAPRHGTASVLDGQVRYAPRPGFVGTDTFTYTIRTDSGESTATVTVTVPAPRSATPKDDDGEESVVTAAQAGPAAASGTAPASASGERSTTSTSTLPNTGGPEGVLLGLASLLLVAGGRLVSVGRRRGRGVGHA